MKGATEHVATYQILLDGNELDEEIAATVREVRIVDSLDMPDLCTLKIGIKEIEELDKMEFEPHSSLEVKLGDMESQSSMTVFKGEIMTLEPEFVGGGVQLFVRAYDRSHRLHRTRHVKTYNEMTATDIVDKICKENGFSLESDASPTVFKYMLQNNETHWEFIWRLATRCGFEFLVNDNVATFKKPAAAEEIELVYGETLQSFKPRLTAAQQVTKVSLRAYDPVAKQEIEAEASTPNQVAQVGIARSSVVPSENPGEIHIATEPVKSAAEGKVVAQALLDRLANGYVGCTGIMLGDPRIKAGVKVKISGVGTKFSGTYRVATSTHILRGGGGYVTEFVNGPQHSVSGLVGSNGGRPNVSDHLMLGVVTDNADPEKAGRVKVYLPALGADAETDWAKVLVTSAGDERGLMMLPIVGEQVLVGFENSDTTRPYVLGSLFNTTDTPGDELASTDGSYAMRSDHKAYFRSKEDMFISSDGPLTIEIKGEVKEKYSNKHTTSVTQAYEVEAQEIKITAKSGDIKVSGINVTVEAQANMELKAGAQMKLTSNAGMDLKTSAIMNIGGTMINIG